MVVAWDGILVPNNTLGPVNYTVYTYLNGAVVDPNGSVVTSALVTVIGGLMPSPHTAYYFAVKATADVFVPPVDQRVTRLTSPLSSFSVFPCFPGSEPPQPPALVYVHTVDFDSAAVKWVLSPSIGVSKYIIQASGSAVMQPSGVLARFDVPFDQSTAQAWNRTAVAAFFALYDVVF